MLSNLELVSPHRQPSQTGLMSTDPQGEGDGDKNQKETQARKQGPLTLYILVLSVPMLRCRERNESMQENGSII